MLLPAAVINEQEQARQEGEAADTEANKYMPCLLAACASGVPKVVTTALDAVVKVRRRRWSFFVYTVAQEEIVLILVYE